MTLCHDGPRVRRLPGITGATALRLALAVVVVGVAVATLHDRVPDLPAVLTALGSGDVGRLVLAASAMFVSMAMFAHHQRRLLFGFGVDFPRGRALALAFSRSALAVSLPAGSVVSAGHAFQQYLAQGADRRAAARVTVLSAAITTAALVLLAGAGVVVAQALAVPLPWRVGPALGAAACAVVVVTLALLWRYVGRAVAARHWLLALSAALANWSAELLCWVLVVSAFDLPVGITTLGVVFLAAQVARQIPLTPGGFGLVEASLLTGLVTAGSGEAAAAAAVLTYRLLSCWLVIPTGYACWAVLRRTRPAQMS